MRDANVRRKAIGAAVASVLLGTATARADAIDITLRSHICPRPPATMALVELTQRCGSEPAHTSMAYLQCIDSVTRDNNRIGAYNSFIESCKTADEAREKAKAEPAPHHAPSISERLERAKASEKQNGGQAKADSSFLEQATKRQQSSIRTYEADVAERRRRDEVARVQAEAQQRRNRELAQETDWTRALSTHPNTHCRGDESVCYLDDGFASLFPQLRNTCHHGHFSTTGRGAMFCIR